MYMTTLQKCINIASFDIGIKNMAFCIFDISSEISIQHWNVLNLMETETPTQVCNCLKIPKTKGLTSKPCSKIAKYQKEGKYYCDTHAKDNATFLIPTKQRIPSYLQKQKMEDLIKIGNSHMLFIEGVPKTKKETLETINRFYEKSCFDNIVVKKSKSAGETDLIHIGKTMKTLLNRIDNIDKITHVVIENQISPLANRMKTIQGMLAQYFIMKNSETEIEFVSSIHKLNQFKDISQPNKKNTTAIGPTVDVSTNNITSLGKTYREHKKGGVEYTRQMLTVNPCLYKDKDAFEESKKKDDLADSFLQGIWYLKHHKYLQYDNDLHISVYRQSILT